MSWPAVHPLPMLQTYEVERVDRAAILFVSQHNSVRSPMAEALARHIAPKDIEILSAGIDPLPVHELTVETLRELHVDAAGLKPMALSQLSARRFDLVVTLCEQTRAVCTAFAGTPAVIHWSLPPVERTTGDGHVAFRALAQRIDEHVHSLFDKGFLYAILGQKRLSDSIMDTLSEGIMAHDLSRRVVYFNRGAERLTGLSASDVLGKDCHEVFSPRLCSGECSFQDGFVPGSICPRRYTSTVLGTDGERKDFDVSLIVMKNDAGEPTGVVATLSDQTRVHALEHQLAEETQFRGIIGQDHKMLAVYDTVRDLAQCDFPVVITGESGTGKELVAHAIHNESPRRDKLFVPINCGALPEGTLESELFGHVRGSFTGAIRDKKGRFELADGGTLFLDEVGELSTATQVKLLRVLQEGTFEPVGGEKTVTVDVRVISASNKDIKAMVGKGTFREDLYYRLAVVPIEMPPLRERRNDIPLLVKHFVERTQAKLSRPVCTLSDETLSVMMSYAWPGNVRQLQNAIQFAFVKCHGTTLDPAHLPPEVTSSNLAAIHPPKVSGDDAHKAGRRPKLSEESVRMAMQRTAGNKAKAARILGVGRATLYNYFAEHPELEHVGEP